MARRLVSTVHVRNPRTSRVETLRAGVDLPDWAEGLVSVARLEADEPTQLQSSDVASVGDGDGADGAAPTVETDGGQQDSSGGEGPDAPGSGAAAASGDETGTAAPTPSSPPNPPTITIQSAPDPVETARAVAAAMQPRPDRPHGNAGRDAWAAYAEALGLTVPADATKAAIRRLVDKHEQG